MPALDPRIDAYIAASAEFAQPILEHLRAIVHDTCPEVAETMKWSFPHFQYKGMLCSMASFKAHCAFSLWKGELLLAAEDDKGKEAMGQFGRIMSVKDLPSKKALAAYIVKAMQLNDDGVKAPARVKPATPRELVVPDYLIAQLEIREMLKPDGGASRLPPLPEVPDTGANDAAARKLAREAKDAQVRGVTSIPDMRDAIIRHARTLPAFTEVPRIAAPDMAAFRARAAQGMPFLITGLVQRWPLCKLSFDALRERFGHVPVRARVGDYVNTAFAPDRAMQDMSMREYLDLEPPEGSDLPPYVGNLELRELNSMCHWPAYLGKMGPPRFWLGPPRTVTPLHCDYDDNIFAQIRGAKRIFLAPPHHGEFLYTSEANAMLYGSPFDPESPDFDKFPLARQASMVEFIVEPGDMLYVPAGWYHQVRALTFSLSSNRWARGMPFALNGDPALMR